jgi:ABC-type multidrug transport system ATPase subunit
MMLGLAVTGLAALAIYLASVTGDTANAAHEVLQFTGLREERYRKIAEYSVGMRQRVKLAQALVHDPPILILDEPTSDLDPNEKAEFLEYLKQIGKERTVLLSTHNLNEVEQACARAPAHTKAALHTIIAIFRHTRRMAGRLEKSAVD